MPSSSNTQWIVAENYGRNPGPGRTVRRGPISSDWVYRDPDQDLDVALAIYPPTVPGTPPDQFHWAILWKIGEFENPGPSRDGRTLPPLHVYRVLELVSDAGESGYTYWGAMTREVGTQTKKLIPINIARLSLRCRQILEQCALEAPVYLPNGKFNCQIWAWDVLRRGIRKGVLKNEDVAGVPPRGV